MLACRHPFVIHKKRRIELSIHPRAVSSLGTGCEKQHCSFFGCQLAFFGFLKFLCAFQLFSGLACRNRGGINQPASSNRIRMLHVHMGFFIAFTCASFFVAVAVPATFKCKPCSFTGAGYFFVMFVAIEVFTWRPIFYEWLHMWQHN